MKCLLLMVFTTITLATEAQPMQLGADWAVGGKYEKILDSRFVIEDYANTKVQYLNAVAQKQKTALIKISDDILIKEDLPADVKYTDILLEVSVKAMAEVVDALKEKEFKHFPLIGFLVDLGIETYKKVEENAERMRQINSKNSIVDALHEMADQVDKIYDAPFTIKIINAVADDMIRQTGGHATSARTDYLNNLQMLTNNYLDKIPSADLMFVRTLERLMNGLYKANPRYGLIRIGIDYRNLAGLDKLILSDLQRKPYNVTIRIDEGPYRTRLMNVLNSYFDRTGYQAMKLRVNRYVVGHVNWGATQGTTYIGWVRPDNSYVPYYNSSNPTIVIQVYLNGLDPDGSFLGPVASLQYDKVNGQGAPASTTYGQILDAAFANVWTNASLYKKFTP